MKFEDISILRVLAAGGHVLYHLDDGWRLYPESFDVEGQRMQRYIADGWVDKERLDSESSKLTISAKGRELLAHAEQVH